MSYRTDRHENPIAFITLIAKLAGLVEGVDYEQGDPFISGGRTYYTARLLKDPIQTCIQVIDKLSFYTKQGSQRWTYIGIPQFLWDVQQPDMKKRIIAEMYQHEGGVEMKDLFK